MKYSLTSLKDKNTHLRLENVVPARTSHIKGYGFGVTLTSRGISWTQVPTYQSARLLKFSEATVVAQ